MGTKKEKILLTGSNGYLGKLIYNHLSKNKAVTLFTIPGRDKFTQKANSIFSGHPIDTIIHAGFSVDFTSQTGSSESSENVLNTKLLLDLSEKQPQKPHFIFLSAAGALGISKSITTRNEKNLDSCDKEYEDYLRSTYIQDKIACEKWIKQYAGGSTTLYLTTVYGPGLGCGTGKQLRKAASGFFPVMACPPGGTSFLDFRDFLEGLDVILEKKPDSDYVISSGNISFKELFQEAIKVGRTQPLPRWPIPLPEASKKWIRALVRNTPLDLNDAILCSSYGYKYYSPAKAQRELGWTPKRKLRDAIEAALA